MELVDPSLKEERMEGMFERLGSRTPSCGICGESDPRCLELHHVVGKKFSNDLITVCRNCHRKLSDDQKDHPTTHTGLSPSATKSIRQKLGKADALRAMADQLEAEASEIFQSEIQKKES